MSLTDAVEPPDILSDDSYGTSDDDTDSEYSLSSSSSDDNSSKEEKDEQPSYDFVQEPSPDIFCPVTLDVMFVPCQTLCCGNHVSFYAARRLRRTKKRCPLCKKFPLMFVKDKYFQRVVLGTRIYCSKKESGCTWVGELRDIQGHLSVGCLEDKQGRCGFVEITCPFKCGKNIERHLMENHKINDCLQRPFSCPHCAVAGTYDSITGDHWLKCKRFPMQCPNECSNTDIQRQLLKRHLSDECSQQEIQCEFSYAGCNSRVKRCKMSEHVEKNVQHHLQSLAKYTLKLHAHTGNSLVLSRDIIFHNFKRYCRTNREWYSPSFYTHIGGYRMCLGVDANGYSQDQSGYLGIAVYMMRGEFDSELQWPFRGTITVELVDQSGGEKNYTVNIVEETSYLEQDYKDTFSRVMNGERSHEGWGFTEFISHKMLSKSKKGQRFIYNDSLHFRITKITVKNV